MSASVFFLLCLLQFSFYYACGTFFFLDRICRMVHLLGDSIVIRGMRMFATLCYVVIYLCITEVGWFLVAFPGISLKSTGLYVPLSAAAPGFLKAPRSVGPEQGSDDTMSLYNLNQAGEAAILVKLQFWGSCESGEAVSLGKLQV